MTAEDNRRARMIRYTAWLPALCGPIPCLDPCCRGDRTTKWWLSDLNCFVPSLRRNWQHAPDGSERPIRTFSCVVISHNDSTGSPTLRVVVHDDDDDCWDWEKLNPWPGEAEAIIRWLDNLAFLDLQAIASRLSPRLGWTGFGARVRFPEGPTLDKLPRIR